MAERDWMELRPDHKGRFDELVARQPDTVHMEMMDNRRLFVVLYRGDEREAMWISSRKGKLEINMERDL